MDTAALDSQAGMADAGAVVGYMAQAVTCAGWPLALSFEWANAIVDEFELVTIPRSPPWLMGAVNIEGGIVPVVDLAVYFDPARSPATLDRHHRLLLGGRTDGSNERALAIVFSGLPMQIQYTRESIDAAVVLPERLRDVCRGMARSNAGKLYCDINTDRFAEFLSLSLMDV